MKFAVAALGAALFIIMPQLCDARTQRPPGGAYQVEAAEGVVNQTLFNGEVRLRVADLHNATDAQRDDVSPGDGQKVIVLTCTMRNGTHENFNGVFEYALADAAGVVVSAESRYIVPNPPPDAPPGGAWRETVSFVVPQDYQPKKLVVTQTVKTNSNDAAKAFRVTIDPSMIR
jgi:hypothetical protein